MDFLQKVGILLGREFSKSNPKSIFDYINDYNRKAYLEEAVKSQEKRDNTLVCANCGKVIEEENSYCTECGSDQVIIRKEYERIKWEKEHPEVRKMKEKELEEQKVKTIEKQYNDIREARKDLKKEYSYWVNKTECPNCGDDVKVNQKFCGKCRANLIQIGVKRYDTVEFKRQLAKKYSLAFEFNGESDDLIEQFINDLKLDNVTYKTADSEKEQCINEIMKNMIDCPVGEFKMGSSSGFLFFGEELGRYDRRDGVNEFYHKVKISKAFKIGKYPVTQKQYYAIIGKHPSKFSGDNNPVENVSWDRAKEFCEKLNFLAKNLPKGFKFDLPTEEQWEYACRAGTTTALNNGKNLTSLDKLCPNLDEVAWYCKNSNRTTHPVGQKKPNAWGIYDMHGNVSEWCNTWVTYNEKNPCPSWFDSAYYRTSEPIVRGGAYSSYNCHCRSASRDHYSSGFESSDIGFRVALVPID